MNIITACVGTLILFGVPPIAGFATTKVGGATKLPSCHGDHRHIRAIARRPASFTPPPPRRSRTPLAAAPVLNFASNIAAGGTLLLSSLLGILFEKVSKSSGGHVVTLLSAALLSNTSQAWSRMKGASILSIPTDHVLYDWCWSVFLPASLVFALLSSSSASSSPAIPGDDDAAAAPKSNVAKRTILGMALPFVAGSLGSIIGCIASFSLVAMPYANQITALLAGCLCASYIGGTVNFFATAKVLRDNAVGDAAMGSAFGSMAAADLVVMAAYFALLSGAAGSTWLRKLFPSSIDADSRDLRDGNNDAHGKCQPTSAEAETRNSISSSTVTAVVLSSSLALASVFVATRLEQVVTDSFPPPFNPPGTMCAFLALLGLMFERLISLALSHKTLAVPNTSSAISMHVTNALRRISAISPRMSNLCFYLLFAAVGTTADLSSAVAGGPTALAFASFALAVHSITVVGFTWAGTRLGQWLGAYKERQSRLFQWPRSSWEEVLTASNAAIGGPSTAAAFAVGLVPPDSDESAEGRFVDQGSYRSALVIGATFWGVFGYAIGTGIGVALSRILMRWR